MSQRKEKWINTGMLAAGIGLLPPAWAVLAPHMGITTGAVALICAGVYVANGNKMEDGVRISIGFLLGDGWSVAALKLMDVMKFPAEPELFAVLGVLGALAVIIAGFFPRFIFLPAWLCGWAIGLTVMSPVGIENAGSLPAEIGAAMLAGVWYVGAGVNKFQRTAAAWLLKPRP